MAWQRRWCPVTGKKGQGTSIATVGWPVAYRAVEEAYRRHGADTGRILSREEAEEIDFTLPKLASGTLVVLHRFLSRGYASPSGGEDSDDTDEAVQYLLSGNACTSGLFVRADQCNDEEKWWVKPRSREWIRELVASQSLFDDERFHGSFRMRLTFEKLFAMVENRITRENTNYREAVPARKVLLAFLYYSAHGVTLRVLHEKFGIGLSTCSEILRRVADAVCALGLICLPSETELVEIALRNEQRSGIPQATLSIDGSHIPILRPRKCGQKYYNRKGFYSTVLHAAVDDRRKFRDVVIGWPGSVGGNRIFSTSYLGRNYETWLGGIRTRQIATSATTTAELPMFLLGDCAYSNRRNFITSYEMTQVAQDTSIKTLNRALSRIRYKVEQAFGILKGRFRILLRANPTAVTDFEFIPTLVYALCSLHNFLIDENDIYYNRRYVQRERAANPPQSSRSLPESPATKTRDTLLLFKADDRAPSRAPGVRGSPAFP
ncbi:hypothetical protein ON010_g8533 [Phytophthora cinnamomi]|nr:hypothetical protein ON010_g8533 [Phytophthora cinnamomi]